MNKKQFWVLSLLSGLLLFGAWPTSPLCLLIFVALVPLLIIAEKTSRRLAFFGYCFIALLIFNAATTWWIWNSTDIGSVAAIVANSLLMCLPWWGFHILLKKHGRTTGYISLGWFWMLFEYVHLNWQLSWPWLTLGNVFASSTNLVQWYEYTGVGGGTLWILLVNVFIKLVLGRWVNPQKPTLPVVSVLIVLLLLPMTVSHFILKVVNKQMQPTANVLIVQGNINPYEKFELSSAQQDIDKLVAITNQAIDSNTQLIVYPETSLSVPTWQGEIGKNTYFKPVFEMLQNNPNSTLVTGIETFRNYGNHKATSTARKSDGNFYYDAFNSAITIKAGEPILLYNKSKLVPGVESMPSFLNFLAPVFEKFGGTTGGYGTSSSSTVFPIKNTMAIAAPVICYESIYGEYVSSYVAKGANLITIITNDGWWGNTPGHKQHLDYACLRAIETRRWVARSANTGISAVIDSYGNIVESQPWDKAAVIKYPIPLLTELSFYTRYGDYLYKGFSFFGLLLLARHCAFAIRRLFTKKK